MGMHVLRIVSFSTHARMDRMRLKEVLASLSRRRMPSQMRSSTSTLGSQSPCQ